MTLSTKSSTRSQNPVDNSRTTSGKLHSQCFCRKFPANPCRGSHVMGPESGSPHNLEAHIAVTGRTLELDGHDASPTTHDPRRTTRDDKLSDHRHRMAL